MVAFFPQKLIIAPHKFKEKHRIRLRVTHQTVEETQAVKMYQSYKSLLKSSVFFDQKSLSVKQYEFVETDSSQMGLLDLHQELLDTIFGYLGVQDLASVRLACHDSKYAIDNYILHFLASTKQKKLVSDFLQNCDGCLMADEKDLFAHLQSNVDASTSFKHFKLIREKIQDGTRRFLVANATNFPHLGTSGCIERIPDSSLNRQIVHLIESCWIHFKINLGVHEPGKYRVRMRFRASDKTSLENSCHGSESGRVSVNKVMSPKPDVVKRTMLVSEDVHFNNWRNIAQGKFNAMWLKSSSIVNSNDGWQFLELRLSLKETAQLEFEFSDIKNRWGKLDLYWDLVEIQKLSTK